MRRSIALAFPLVILAAAVGLVAWGSQRVPEPTFNATLHDLLPPPPSGWTVKEKPIADSPEMQKAVGELLNFDDGVFVDYLGPGGDRLSVYIAYWTPGRMSHRLIASHTPDICWVGGGWTKTAASQVRALTISTPSSGNGASLVEVPTGESRTFLANGNPEYVWFWHLVGEESKSYGTGHTAPWYAAMIDVLRKGLNQREEQFFIRVSSSSPLEPQMTGPVLPSLLANFPWRPEDR